MHVDVARCAFCTCPPVSIIRCTGASFVLGCGSLASPLPLFPSRAGAWFRGLHRKAPQARGLAQSTAWRRTPELPSVANTFEEHGSRLLLCWRRLQVRFRARCYLPLKYLAWLSPALPPGRSTL